MTDQNWALDATLVRMIELLRENLDDTKAQTAKIVTSLKSIAASKMQSDLKIHKFADSLNGMAPQLKTYTASTDSANAEILRLTKSYGKNDEAVSESTKSWKKWGAFASTQLGIWGLITHSIRRVGTTALELERQGLAPILRTQTGLSNNIKSLQSLADKAGLAMTTMHDIIQGHGVVLSQVSSVKFADSVSSLQRAFSHLAVTSEEMGTYMIEALETQRQQGLLSYMSEAASLKMSRDAVANTLLFSKALKMSREEVEAARKAEGEDISTAFLQQELIKKYGEKGEKMGTDLQAVIMSLQGNPEMQKNVKSAFYAKEFSGALEVSPNMQNLYAAGQVGQVEVIRGMVADIQSGLVGNDTATYLERMIKAINAIPTEESRIIGILSILGEAQASGAETVAVEMSKLLQAYKPETIEEVRKNNYIADAASKATSDTINMLQKIKAEFDNMLVNVFGKDDAARAFADVVGSIVTALIKLRPYINDITNAIGEWIAELGRILSGATIGDDATSIGQLIGQTFVDLIAGAFDGFFSKDFWVKLIKLLGVTLQGIGNFLIAGMHGVVDRLYGLEAAKDAGWAIKELWTEGKEKVGITGTKLTPETAKEALARDWYREKHFPDYTRRELEAVMNNQPRVKTQPPNKSKPVQDKKPAIVPLPKQPTPLLDSIKSKSNTAESNKLINNENNDIVALLEKLNNSVMLVYGENEKLNRAAKQGNVFIPWR